MAESKFQTGFSRSCLNAVCGTSRIEPKQAQQIQVRNAQRGCTATATATAAVQCSAVKEFLKVLRAQGDRPVGMSGGACRAPGGGMSRMLQRLG